MEACAAPIPIEVRRRGKQAAVAERLQLQEVVDIELRELSINGPFNSVAGLTLTLSPSASMIAPP